MRVRAIAGGLALALALAAAPAIAQEPAARVYGVELERAPAVDRLLVLTSGRVEPTLEEVSAGEVALRFVDAVLDPRTPRQLSPAPGSAIRGVRLTSEEGPPPRVEIRVVRAPGLRTELSRKGTIVALEIERPPEPAPAREGATVRMNLRDRPLVDLVREVQRISQRTFVWDDRLQGTATVIVQDPVTPGEALEILHATLLAKGFAAMPTPDGAMLVLPLDDARARAPKREQRALSQQRATLVTVLVRFRTANAEQLVNLLAPFAGATTQVVAHAPTNGAILVGPESAIHRWLELAHALDEASGRELAVIRPRERPAAELFPILQESLRDPLTGRARAELTLDERTNALIVRADPRALATLRAQVAALDAPHEATGRVLVIRPRFADLTALADQLAAIGSGRVASQRDGDGSELRFSVATHPGSRALLITADAATLAEVRALVDKLDVEPPLIAIEANVLEIATTGQLALGIDAFIPSTDPSQPGRTIFGLGVGDPFDQQADSVAPTFLARYARTPVVIPVIGPGGIPINVSLPREIVQIKANAGEARVRSLMQPRLVTTSGEEHELSAGLNLPIPTAQAGSAGGEESTSGGGDLLSTRVSIERQDVGIRLRVKPIAGQAGDVRIAVDLEVTAVQPSAEGAREGIGPELARRTLQAHTRVEDGGAAVLGMLIERSEQHSETGAPGLKDVPVLGNLLRQSLDREGERYVLLTLQAHILRTADERLADTLRVRTAHERALARSGTLLGAGGGKWALLVATRPRREDAEALAASLGDLGGRSPRVVAWRWDDVERFDVVYAGFADVREAADALPALEARGATAQLVPVPSGEGAAGN